MHSTKNLEIVRAPTTATAGVGVFEYTDNYSVFHYGRMPDVIPARARRSAGWLSLTSR